MPVLSGSLENYGQMQILFSLSRAGADNPLGNVCSASPPSLADVVAGAAEVVAGGGKCNREPEPENGEPPHLAMCENTEGNQFMLSWKRA